MWIQNCTPAAQNLEKMKTKTSGITWWVRAFSGFTQSPDVPAPRSDSHWWTARFGRALHSPKRRWEENVVTITSRNKTEQQLQRQSLSSQPFPNHTQRWHKVSDRGINYSVIQLHLMWLLLSVDKEQTIRFCLSWGSLQPVFLWFLLHVDFTISEVSGIFFIWWGKIINMRWKRRRTPFWLEIWE